MKITSNELNKLEKIGEGGFGTVYRKDDKAIKVYKPLIVVHPTRKKVHNPSLNPSSIVFLGRKIKNLTLEKNKLPTEKLFVDNFFSGVCYDFQEGRTLNRAIKDNHQIKKLAGFQMVEQVNELTNHCIYPTDLKTANVLIDDNNQIHLLDLDDMKTKTTIFPHLDLRQKTINALSETLISYYSNNNFKNINTIVASKLESPIGKLSKQFNHSYNDLLTFINDYFKPQNFVLLNSSDLDIINLEQLRKNVLSFNLKIVLILDNEQKITLNDILYLKENGISLYDIIVPNSNINENIGDYIISHNTQDIYQHQGQKIKKLN